MSIAYFKTTQNLSLLWDVFLDEVQVSHTNKELMANQNTSIMELNKQFLKQIVVAVNRLFPHLKNMKRITIMDEEVSSPYKIEDIQASRQSDFEREVEKKQMEMESYLTLKKPQHVNFSDNNDDQKIGSMELLIAEKIAQRNSEILPPIQQVEQVEQWLQPKKTSIKTEVSNKKVTWHDDETTNNIFQKLKKVPEQSNQIKQYEEQQSVQLPDVKQEQIISNPTSNHINAFIPKNDLVLQITELHKKMDKIIDMLTTLMENQNK